MRIRNILLTITLLGSGAANASTILQATDGDVNFVSFGSTIAAGGTVYMFDDDFNDQVLSTTDGLFVPIPSIVTIGGPDGSGDYTATSATPEVISLTAAPDFIVALYFAGSGTWLTDNGSTDLGANTQRLDFGERAGEQILVDVTVQPIPVPAAVWLFGSGLLGLVGIARRRKTV